MASSFDQTFRELQDNIARSFDSVRREIHSNNLVAGEAHDVIFRELDQLQRKIHSVLARTEAVEKHADTLDLVQSRMLKRTGNSEAFIVSLQALAAKAINASDALNERVDRLIKRLEASEDFARNICHAGEGSEKDIAELKQRVTQLEDANKYRNV